MLSAKQYQAIGKLTIGFNEIDSLTEGYLGEFLGIQEFFIGEVILSREKFFRQRMGLFEEVLKAIRVHYSDLRPDVATILGYTRQAQKLSEQRNSIVHGLLVSDRKNRPMLRFKNVDARWNQPELDSLLSDLNAVVDGLTKYCYELELALETRRTGKSK